MSKKVDSPMGTNDVGRTYEFVSDPYNPPLGTVEIPAVCVHDDGSEHPSDGTLPCSGVRS